MDEKESYDPVVEAKKIEEAIMKNVVRAENAVKLARECGVMAKLRAAKSVLPISASARRRHWEDTSRSGRSRGKKTGCF